MRAKGRVEAPVRVITWTIRLRMEWKGCHWPCIFPFQLICPLFPEMARLRLLELEYERAREVPSPLSTERQCHMDTCLCSDARKHFLLNRVLTEALLCSKSCWAPLFYRKNP